MSVMPNEVPSLIIPLSNKSLLVPNSCVAEIIPKTKLVNQSAQYPWLLGELEWRDLLLPCISFESLAEKENETILENIRSVSGMSVAIFHTLSETYHKRFYALAIHGIPRLARVIDEEIVEDIVEANHFEKMHVKLNGEACAIPDLDSIETLLAST